MGEMTTTTVEQENNDDLGPSERRKAAAQILARGMRRLLTRVTPGIGPSLLREPDASVDASMTAGNQESVALPVVAGRVRRAAGAPGTAGARPTAGPAAALRRTRTSRAHTGATSWPFEAGRPVPWDQREGAPVAPTGAPGRTRRAASAGSPVRAASRARSLPDPGHRPAQSRDQSASARTSTTSSRTKRTGLYRWFWRTS